MWISVFEYGLNILVSGSLLLVQYGMLRQNQTETRLKMVSMLFEQAREQYRISKENIEAINLKCHDLKHQLLAVKDKTDEKEYARMMDGRPPAHLEERHAEPRLRHPEHREDHPQIRRPLLHSD